MNSNLEQMLPVGIRYALLSAFSFAWMSACVKYVSLHGIPLFEIVAARALVSLLLSYLDVKRKKISVWGNNKRLLFARGAIGTMALMCVYYAMTALPLAEATILQYVHPVFTAILGLLFLKERVRMPTVVCILFCLVGLGFIIQPTLVDRHAGEALPLFSIMIALLGAFGSSIAYVIVRKLARTEDSSVIIFYFPLIALPTSLILMWHEFSVPSLTITLVLILVGVFTQIGQYGLTMAMRTQPAGQASAYSYVQIVFASLIGVIVFNEVPSTWTYLGGSFIIAGALFNIFGARFILK